MDKHEDGIRMTTTTIRPPNGYVIEATDKLNHSASFVDQMEGRLQEI